MHEHSYRTEKCLEGILRLGAVSVLSTHYLYKLNVCTRISRVSTRERSWRCTFEASLLAADPPKKREKKKNACPGSKWSGTGHIGRQVRGRCRDWAPSCLLRRGPDSRSWLSGTEPHLVNKLGSRDWWAQPSTICISITQLYHKYLNPARIFMIWNWS